MDNLLVNDDLSGRKNCLQCKETISAESKFCKHCGGVQTELDAVSYGAKWAIIKQTALFYAIEIIICCVASNVTFFKTLNWSIFFDFLFAIIGVIFFCDKWQANRHTLKWPNFSFLKVCLYAVLAITASVGVSYCTKWLNHTLFSQEMYYYGVYASSSYGKLLMIFFVAVMPALFEELAFRGYLLQNLTYLADSKQAVFISAFLFAIIHMSFLSLFWLIPFALFIGFLRIKEQTIWYGVVIHFFFNLTACMLELNSIYGRYIFDSF